MILERMLELLLLEAMSDKNGLDLDKLNARREQLWAEVREPYLIDKDRKL